MGAAGGGSGGQSAYNSNVCTQTDNGTGTDPYIKVKYTSASATGTPVTTTTTISGATSSSLTLSANRVGIQTVRCKLTHPVAVNADSDAALPVTRANSAIYTETATFETISATNSQISQVTYDITKDWDTLSGGASQNLFLGSLNLAATTVTPNRTITLFAPDENITVKIRMSGGAGDGFNGNHGGAGGGTVFTHTLIQDTEYTFKFGYHTDENGTASLGRGGPGAYFYEKGVLLVACGGGGASGWYGGNGGAGGGAGIAGDTGSGPYGGTGGVAVATGQLPAAGQQQMNWSGGLGNLGVGGKVESCTSGQYWAQQGYSPCSQMGYKKFRDFSGSEAPGSPTLLRGYKAASNLTTDAGWNGYRTNGGFSQSHVGGTFVGGGGSGAYGGNSCQGTSSGGGGASGYTNGAVNIISAQQGTNSQNFSFALIELP
tara:strand:- start:1773 stop:3065 length:1293 start_codon:yes stop_codon:yes gene_type:complete